LGGFKDFMRFGIGIGRPEQRDQNVVADYVLKNFD
jgi:peptidyl-tRNA hydrolase